MTSEEISREDAREIMEFFNGLTVMQLLRMVNIVIATTAKEGNHSLTETIEFYKDIL